MAMVFLSYSWTDNAPGHKEREDGWVKQFREELEKQLRLYKGWHEGEPPIVWQDVQNIRGIGDIADQLAAEIDRVLVFCAVVTNSYITSGWCAQELDRFKGRVLRECMVQANRLKPKEVIAKIVRMPTEGVLPPVLQGSTGHVFFRKNEVGAALPIRSPEYETLVTTVAYEIYEVVKRINAQQPVKGLIYFCAPSADADASLAPLANELKAKGYGVIGAMDDAVPGTPTQCRDLIEKRMRQALLTVHLVGDLPPDDDVALMPDVEREELTIALKLCQETDGPPLFLWCSHPFTAANLVVWPERPAVTDVLNADVSTNQLRTSKLGLDALKTDLVKLLDSLRR